MVPIGALLKLRPTASVSLGREYGDSAELNELLDTFCLIRFRTLFFISRFPKVGAMLEAGSWDSMVPQYLNETHER